MATDLKIGFDGDLVFNGRDFELVHESDEVRQRVDLRLQSTRGGWVFNRALGIPTWGEGGIHSVSMTQSERLDVIRECVAGTNGVASVDAVDAVTINAERRMLITYKATTVYHVTIAGEVIL